MNFFLPCYKMKQISIFLILFFAMNDVASQHYPIQIFDELWNEFNEKYANFELKKVDWKNVYDEFRPKVTDKTSEKDLFEICCQMIQTLSDGHVTMAAIINKQELSCGPPYEFKFFQEFPTQEEYWFYNDAVDQSLSSYGFEESEKIFLTEDTNFEYRTSDKLGYLRLDEMMESNKLGKLKRALNKSFDAFQNKEGLIIDLRTNGGGWDVVSYKLAGRLVNKKKVGHYKKTKIKGSPGFKKLKTWTVKPIGKYCFDEKVVVLTSGITASASEVFLLTVMDLPNVTIVGDQTEGIFSDMNEFELKNGWEVSLSDQQFFSKDMINYEGVGIKPAVNILNKNAEARRGKDSVIDKAVEILMKKNR